MVIVENPLTIGVDFRDHNSDFLLVDILSEGLHDGSQLSGGHGSGVILIEDVEGILELTDLVVVEAQLGFEGLKF